ncbi:TPA: SP_0924 family bacteriocin-like peptide [Streptococcus pneumoniae]
MILMTKNINLTNEELDLIQGGADPYGKEPNGYYPWKMEPVLTLLVHGFCPRDTDDLGYIGGGNHLCKGSAARF